MVTVNRIHFLALFGEFLDIKYLVIKNFGRTEILFRFQSQSTDTHSVAAVTERQ